jgi:tagaturonate epimerase
VIDIDPAKLPSPAIVSQWSSEEFAASLRHDRSDARFNPHLRQLLHVAYKLAARKGAQYLGLVSRTNGTISRNVTSNLFDRHIKPLFIGG